MRRQVIQAVRLDIEAVVNADDAIVLLVFGELALRYFQVIAQQLGLFAEIRRDAAHRIDLQLDAGLLVLVRKGICHGGDELRVAALEADVDHAAFARWHDFHFFQQQVGQPVAHGAALAFCRLIELRDHGRTFRQFQMVDDAQGNVLAADDIDLRRHKTRQQLARHGQASQRVDTFVVQEQRTCRLVCFRQEQTDRQRAENSDQQRDQDQLLVCTQDQ
ncbi:hypothetical protein D3C72_1307260 [compost metagenome]